MLLRAVLLDDWVFALAISLECVLAVVLTAAVVKFLARPGSRASKCSSHDYFAAAPLSNDPAQPVMQAARRDDRARQTLVAAAALVLALGPLIGASSTLGRAEDLLRPECIADQGHLHIRAINMSSASRGVMLRIEGQANRPQGCISWKRDPSGVWHIEVLQPHTPLYHPGYTDAYENVTCTTGWLEPDVADPDFSCCCSTNHTLTCARLSSIDHTLY